MPERSPIRGRASSAKSEVRCEGTIIAVDGRADGACMARPSRTAEANMRTAAARPIEACLLDLVQHFGIERAHIAPGGPPPLKDWHSLATLHPERVVSLTLISPPMLDTAPLAGLASRILIVAGGGADRTGPRVQLGDVPFPHSRIGIGRQPVLVG